MSYEGDRDWVVALTAGASGGRERLGGKGANLAELVGLGLPVPPGLVIATDACRAYGADGSLAPGLLDEVIAELGAIGERLGRRFGDVAAPLLVSVRSGAPVSMPGMMDTVLNVGLTPATRQGVAALVGDDATAACAERLRRTFEETAGGPPPEAPSEQLERAIAAVFESWGSRRAQLYRRFHGIPDSGTAVVVQAMVFGNAGPGSGTGVAFTRDPSTGARELFGEYLADGQGEEVVDGSRNVGDLAELRLSQPDAYAELEHHARAVEEHFADMCELEFTLERGRLWLLQSRSGQRAPRAAARIAADLVREGAIDRATALERVDVAAVRAALRPELDAAAVDPASVLASGTGSAPGLATGIAALDSETAVRRAEAGETVILVRPETTPKDLDGMIACAGLLTTRGGKTSHAAVVARGLGKSCVCGAEGVEVDLEHRLLRAGGRELAEGELISIDGDGGLVLAGAAPTRDPEPLPELVELEQWAAAGQGAPGGT
jgi:pyruvate, orthophosphate dikinase